MNEETVSDELILAEYFNEYYLSGRSLLNTLFGFPKLTSTAMKYHVSQHGMKVG